MDAFEQAVADLVKHAEAVGDADLTPHVEEFKAGEAMRINERGIKAQIEYMLRYLCQDRPVVDGQVRWRGLEDFNAAVEQIKTAIGEV